MIKIVNSKSLYAALYQAVDYCKNNPYKKIEIVVPDKLSLFMEKFLFEQMHISASFNLKVSTFNRFAKKNVDVDKENTISKIGEILLVYKILNDNIDKLSILKSKAYSFSYAEEISNTLGQLKASKVRPDDMGKFASSNEQLDGKIKDLKLIYEEYENLKAGKLDQADIFVMSAMTVAQGKGNSDILFLGFDDFTAIQYLFLEQLATKTNVVVFNYYGDKANRHIYNREVFDHLKQIAVANELPFEIENDEPEFDELKTFLMDNLFSTGKQQFLLKDKLVKLYEGNSVEAEIEYVARDIKEKVIAGKSFDQFGVAIYDADKYLTTIKEIFSKYEINAYFDTDLSVNNSIFCKFLKTVFKYNFESYNLSHLIDLISSPFFDENEETKYRMIDYLEKIDFKGKLKNNFKFPKDIDSAKLFEFLSLIEIDKTWDIDTLIEKIKLMDENLCIKEKLNTLQEQSKDLQFKILTMKSHEVVFNVFDEIKKIYLELDVVEFYDVFSKAVGVTKLSNLPLTLDAVKVVDATNDMEIFNDLYIVNCTHDNAPQIKFDCGIILDKEIEELNSAFKLSPTIAHINKLSALRFFNLLTMFEENLILTFGKSKSDVVGELKNKILIETENGIKNIFELQDKFDEKYLILSAQDKFEIECKKRKEKLKNNENGVKKQQISYLNQENLKIFKDLNCVSPSKLENYFKCPFYSFNADFLKIKTRQDAEIEAFDIGNILHEILFKYYKKKKQIGDIYEFCKTEVFEYLDKDERLKLNVKSPIIKNLIDEAVRVIAGMDYIDNNSNFKPIVKMLEHSFIGATALKLKNIDIVGKIDRVDECNDMLRVVDYKSGKADASLDELYYGNKLQLFLYSCAVQKELNKKVVGSFYLPLHNNYNRDLGNNYSLKGFFLNEDFVVTNMDTKVQAGERSDIFNATLTKEMKAKGNSGHKELADDDLKNLQNYSMEVSEQAVNDMCSGYIKPTPSEVSSPCDYCPYVHICLKSCNDIKYRPKRKVDLSSFKEEEDA